MKVRSQATLGNRLTGSSCDARPPEEDYHLRVIAFKLAECFE
jgi:hypothetical protein